VCYSLFRYAKMQAFLSDPLFEVAIL